MTLARLRRSKLWWLLLFGPPLLCVLVVAASIPVTMPQLDYWTDMLEMARHGVISQHFTPSGYPFVVALGPLAFPRQPVAGLVVAQALVHMLLVAATWAVLRRLGASLRAALLGTWLLQASPELLFSVVKVWDVAFSSLLLLLIVWLSLWVLQAGATWKRCLLLGAVFAFACFDRPNYAVLLPAFLLPLRGRRTLRAGGAQLHPWQGMAALLLASGVVYGALSLAAFHQIRTPGNGAYNLYAGNNPYTAAALREHLNAEPSLMPALISRHIPLGPQGPADPALQPLYRGSSLQFIRQQPGAESALVLEKLWTFLRPDTKIHPLATLPGVGKAILALYVPLWLLTLVLLRRRLRWAAEDGLVILVAVLYVLPFLLTNSDPRFRTPLDLLLGAHTVALWWRRDPGVAVDESERASVSSVVQ